MAEHELTCAACGVQFNYHRRKRYCSRACQPGNLFKGIAPVAVACAGCGNALPERRHPMMRYCGARCSRQAEASRRQEAQPLVDCYLCGKQFRPKGSDRTKFCGRKCGLTFTGAQGAARAGGSRVTHTVLRRKCIKCGVPFTAESSRQHRCVDCHAPVSRDYYKPVKGQTRECAECATPFIAMSGGEFSSIKFCSKPCKNAAMRKSPNYRELQKAAKARRRARKKGSANCETVSVIKVFERDGWRCQICGRMTIKARRGQAHPMAPELDHIVALANGGDHSYRNTQCACRSCNGAKGARDYGQIPLFATP